LAAKPFVQSDAAESRFAQRHEQVLLDPTAEVSGLGVGHHLARVADRLQVAGDDLVKWGPVGACDLDDAVSWRLECHNFPLSNCSWKDGEIVATFRQPFDLLAQTTVAATRATVEGNPNSAKSEIWLGDQDSNLD
jgi:hypothetical protein